MKALITGASSGIGRDIARELAARGCELILAARRRDRMEALAAELSVPVRIVECDLSREEECLRLYEETKDDGVDILVNNAGFGLFGPFDETDLSRELEMIDVNVRAVHILTKKFVIDFKRRDSGYILNVASSAAFLPGPLLSAYYATKAYVLRLSQALWKELRKSGSRVSVSVLCPGPVRTEFDRVANVRFSLKAMSSEAVARIAVRGMFARKTVVVPGLSLRLGRIAAKLLPDRLLMAFAWRTQKKKAG